MPSKMSDRNSSAIGSRHSWGPSAAVGNIPASVVLNGFRTVHPVAEVTGYVDLWDKLDSDQYVAGYQTMGRWSKDHIPFPGAVARQTAEMLVRENAFITDRLVLDGRPVQLPPEMRRFG